MKGIDTNVLLRFLVQDDVEQAWRATRFITTECTIEDPGLINHVVLCELVWVMENAYRYPHERVADALEEIMRAVQLKVDEPQDVRAALLEYQDGADFPDALIALVNLRLGCEGTVTFDRRAGKRAGFRAL